jgi:hypothetical protein
VKYRKRKSYEFELLTEETFHTDVRGYGTTTEFIHLSDEGLLTISKHYSWDGSSVPLKRMIKPVWNSDKYCGIASLIHDALYQLIRDGNIPKSCKTIADLTYRNMCILGGMGKLQAAWRYKALRWFGWSALHKKKVNQIIEVPLWHSEQQTI